MRAVLLLSAMLVACLVAAPAPAEEGTEPAASAPAMQPAQPGPEHAFLAKHAGKWKAIQKSMMDPTQPPAVSEGVEECELICAGLFLKSTYTVKDASGEFHGIGILGYDTSKKKYVGTWVDNYGTGIYPYEGTCDGDTCTYVMEVPGPDGKPTPMTMIYKIIDDNNRSFTMLMPGPDGTPTPTMEVQYTRM